MKRLLTFLLTLGLLFTLSSPVFASSDVKINANGNILKDAQAVIQNGSTLLPVRSVSNAFGCEVDWNGDTKTVSVNKDDTQITIVIGQQELTVNNNKQSISAPAQIINGRTYVPLRALGEALNCEIQWVNDTRTVEITPNDPAEYKAWYEVDENGQVWLKTNINSRSWGGYFLLAENRQKNEQHGDLTTMTGTGIIQYRQNAFGSRFDAGSVPYITDIYLFKGTNGQNNFWNLVNRHGFDTKKLVSLMTNDLACHITIENNLIVKETSQKLSINDFQINYDAINKSEQGLISLENAISETGEYVLHYDSNHKQVNNTIRGFAPLEKSDNSLSFSSQDAFFTAPGTSGTFYVVYTSYSIDAVGTIIISRTVSDGIAYTFPDQ